MKKFKKVIFFVIVLAIFMIPGFIFGKDTDFYKEINKPVFAPKGIVFSIVWVFLYTIQAYYITHIYYNYKDNNEGKKLFVLLIINGIINILYTPIFFALESIFGGFVISLLLFVSTLLIVAKSKQLMVKEWYLEIPYLLWTTFALVLSISIYLMN
jgi:tryptophan-rich sensory protein